MTTSDYDLFAAVYKSTAIICHAIRFEIRKEVVAV